MPWASAADSEAMDRSLRIRIAIAIASALVAAFAVTIFMSSRETASTRSDTPIWEAGDRWTVTVRQDGGSVAPGGEGTIANVKYRFAIDSAPKTDAGAWVVKVTQEGAEGPFRQGWKLDYRERGDGMHLVRATVGAQKAVPANLATVVLGLGFPLTARYDAPPRDETVDADELAERTVAPPSGQEISGSTPPSSGTAPDTMPPAGRVPPPAEGGPARR